MKRNTKTSLLFLVCFTAPFFFGLIRDHIIPFDPNSYLDSWRIFPLISAMFFVTAYPFFVKPKAWSRSISAVVCSGFGGLAGFILHGYIGASIAVVSAYIGSAVLSVMFDRAFNPATMDT